MKIKKAVIPVAGKGTRFLPATKEIPKEMIPILNTPMISIVVEEAVKAGITEIIFVNSRGKESIENYFDRNLHLESFLKEADKNDQELLIKNIGSNVEVLSVRQKEQLGLGHAINCARPLIGNEPFAVLLGDDIMDGEVPGIKQLIDKYEELSCSGVIGLFEVPKSETSKYGIIEGEKKAEGLFKLNAMVEKPTPKDAPSNLAVPGRYVFDSEIFVFLDKIPRGVGGEYQLTDAIEMMAKERDVYGAILDGTRFDTGSMEGYLEATIAYASRDEKLKKVIVDSVKKYT